MKKFTFFKQIAFIALLQVCFTLSISAQECGWLKIMTPDNTKGYPIYAGTLDFSSNAVTFETWLRGNRDGVIAGCSHSPAGFYLRPSGGYSGLQFGGLTSQLYLDLKQPTDTTTWYHFAMVIDGQNVKFYKNGVLTSSKDNASPVSYTNTSADPLFIGDSKWVHGKSNFSFADIRVWNYARTADEIAANYQARVAPGTPGLVINYTFMEQQGSTTSNLVNPNANGGELKTCFNGDFMNYDPTKYAWGKIGVVPTNLTVTNKTSSGFNLAWAGSDDNKWEIELTDPNWMGISDTAAINSATIAGLTESSYTVHVRTIWPFVSDWSQEIAVDLTSNGIGNVQYLVNFTTRNGIILLNNLEGNNNIAVYNTSGSMVHQFKSIATSYKIDATNWVHGLYVFKISNNEKIKTLKVVL